MELFYCKSPLPNFGDDMNAWFWDEIFPDFHALAPERTMFGIGSILWRDNVERFDRIVVMGSRTGVGILPDIFPADTLFQFVRGPRTARQFGLAADRAITDPACCTPLLAGLGRPERPHGEALLVPHAGSANLPLDWGRIAEAAGLRFVSPSGDSRAVIREIAGASPVVTESMHGAILADAYRVPWIPVAIRPNFVSFKWLDWSDSMEIDLRLASALDGGKRAYAALRKARHWLARRQEAAGRRRGSQRRIAFASSEALATSQEYRIGEKEKTALRQTVARHARLLEALLIRDLRRVRHSPPHLSADAVLQDRQARIFARIEETRRLLSRAPEPGAEPAGLARAGPHR